MIEHYSSRIQNAIQRELFKATQSIKLAVAWFTNDLLFQPLLLKLSQGVSVEVILNDDVINRTGENSLDFSIFVQNGGVLRWNSSDRLMHDKFCIIDDDIVIFGSYNWTFKAEFNEESITIARSERSTLDFYQKKFSKLSLRYSSETKNVSQVQYSSVQKRGDAIKNVFQPANFAPYFSLNFRISFPNHFVISCNSLADGSVSNPEGYKMFLYFLNIASFFFNVSSISFFPSSS